MLFRVLLLGIPVLLLAGSVPTYTIQTIAGTNFAGDGGAATSAILSQPEGIAVDSSGNVYIADADDNRVRVISLNGVIQTFAGTGHRGFSGDGGPATKAQLNQPYGLALDLAGNLLVADLGNGRIRKIAADGNISTVAGGGTAVPSVGSNINATEAMLNTPRNIAFDAAGNLYISDFGANQVYMVSSAGILSVLAGSGTAGFSGDGSWGGGAQLSAPAGLVCDSNGNLYIADSGNGRVREVVNGLINTVFSVASPTGLAMGRGNTLYIAADGYFGTIAMSLGSGVSARDVAADASGNLFLTSELFVKEIGANGSMTVIAGSGAARYYGGDGAPASAARLHQPSGVAIDDLGNVYIADTGNNRIRRILPDGTMTTFAGVGDGGSTDQFNAPLAVALDSQRNLYVADSGNNRVCEITPSGVVTVVADHLDHPAAVAVAANGTIYIADTGKNRVLELAPGSAATVIGEVLQPAGLAIDPSGTLYISESHRVSKVAPGGTVTTVADALVYPQGLAVLASGDVAVAESGRQRVVILHGGAATPIAGIGTAGFGGDGGPALAALLDAPAGVGLDAQANVWIADSGNQRIRKLIPTVDPMAPETLAPLTVVNAASQASGAIAAGEIISIYGAGFVPAQTQVLFDGKPATVFFTNATQINALVPGVAPGSSTDVKVVVDGGTVGDVPVPVVSAAPGIFLLDAGTGQAAVMNQDGTYNSSTQPAPRESYVSLFATGWSDPSLLVMVTIGGYDATVLYAGPAPGFPGLMQINLQVPGGFLGPGRQSLSLTVGTAPAQSGATIALQ